MTFERIETKERCHVCGQDTATHKNGSVLYCDSCKQEAQELSRKRGKRFVARIPVYVRIDAKELMQLRQIASNTGRSFNYLINLAIKAFIKKEGVK